MIRLMVLISYKRKIHVMSIFFRNIQNHMLNVIKHEIDVILPTKTKIIV